MFFHFVDDVRLMHPYDRIPELAGLTTYDDAARIGYSVEQSVARLLRYHWTERRLMSILVAHLPSAPVWEVKCALALHQWQSAEHVEALRRRVAEMRNPAPALDIAPHGALDAFLEELQRSNGVIELVAGVYGVAYPAVAAAYERHLSVTNALVDQPTRRLLRMALVDTEEAISWGARALDALLAAHPDAVTGATSWQEHLRAYAGAAGGIAGDAEPHGDVRLPEPRSPEKFVPEMTPRRDERFHGQYEFEFPPHVVYSMPEVIAAERNLALLCKRTLEMDVPEMMASFMTERDNQPWEFYRDYSRQLWDEARHAMMGSVALAARGVDWKRDIPLNIGFALRLNRHAEPVERQIMLFAIEQSLMPASTGKRFEYETAVAAGDNLSAHFHDYDWADEVLHAQIGRRMVKRDGITVEEARERARAIHEKTWATLERYRDPRERRDWWPAFVRKVLGRESDVASTRDLGPVNILAE